MNSLCPGEFVQAGLADNNKFLGHLENVYAGIVCACQCVRKIIEYCVVLLETKVDYP